MEWHTNTDVYELQILEEKKKMVGIMEIIEKLKANKEAIG
jgi:hypothetical protein